MKGKYPTGPLHSAHCKETPIAAYFSTEGEQHFLNIIGHDSGFMKMKVDMVTMGRLAAEAMDRIFREMQKGL